MTTVYVPGDAGALSVGAGEVAGAIAAEAKRRGAALNLVRNGSRGAYFLEPLVEVQTPRERCAYGPVRAADVPSLFAADFLNGGTIHCLSGSPNRSRGSRVSSASRSSAWGSSIPRALRIM